MVEIIDNLLHLRWYFIELVRCGGGAARGSERLAPPAPPALRAEGVLLLLLSVVDIYAFVYTYILCVCMCVCVHVVEQQSDRRTALGSIARRG